MSRIYDLFEKYNSEFLQFECVLNKRSNRPDLHAFMLLDELMPDDKDIVSSASHDQIWLWVELDKLDSVIDETQVRELVQCGIFIDEDALSMFV